MAIVSCLVNTNILLRISRRSDPQHKLALRRFDFFLARGETAEDIRDLLGHFAGLGEGLKSLVNVCCVSLFARPDRTDNDKPLLFVDSVDHAVC